MGVVKLADYRPQLEVVEHRVADKRDSIVVVAQLSPEFTARLVDRWRELEEAAVNIPKTLPEALRLAADLAEKKMQLENQLAIAAPKVEFADRVGEASGILIGNFAKVVGIGPNKLFAWMRDHKILIASGSRRNVPMQEYMDRGYFTVKETAVTRMIRTIPLSKPPFGQDCVVRVMDATKAGSSDEFVRGIVFDGFVLDRGTVRRAASKGMGTICFHANYGMGMTLGLIAFGAEYGVFGYSFWASTGWLKIDSCHKAFWADATLITPENPSVPSEAVNTTFDFDIRIDACVFGLVLNRVKYSKFTGYIEGIAVSSSSVPFPIYDSENETAIAITAVRCDSVDITEMGIEYWEGVHVYSNESTLSVNMSWTQDKTLKNTTGKHGPYQSVSQLTGVTELFTLPSTNNSYYYSVNKSLLTLRNMTGDMSGASFANTFLVTVDANARFLMMNTGVYFGSSRLIAPANWANIECINDPFMPNYLVPEGYRYEGRGQCTARSWSLKAINGGDGKVSLHYGSEIPTGWELIDWTVHVITENKSQASSIGISSVSNNSVTFQTNVTSAGFSIQYKLRLRVSK